MSEIRVGQIWKEKAYNQRVMRVDDVVEHTDGSIFAARMVMVSGKGRPRTDIRAYVLRAGWTMIEEAPDAPLRRISLDLARDTTAERCGACPRRTIYEFCGAFKRDLLVDEDGNLLRLPECVAAEVRP